MISVIIATHNGALTLPLVFERMAQLRAVDGGWELVVADNASTDATREVVNRYRDCLPIKYVFESRKGQNHAREAALAIACGELIAFTDDDILVSDDWLVSIHAAAMPRPDIDVFGGHVVAHYLEPPPEWVERYVDKIVVFGLTDPALKDGPTQAGSVISPCMAIRRRVFEAGHRFDSTIGPDGSATYPMGSESEFLARIEGAGCRFWFCANWQVAHIVRPYQFDRRWILRRAFRFGRGQYRIHEARTAPNPRRIFGVPGYLIRQIIELGFCRILLLARGYSDKAFRCEWNLQFFVGEAFEARRMYIAVHEGRALNNDN